MPSKILNVGIAALCDVSAIALAHCSKKFHIPTTYSSLTDMLKGSPEIDVVFILTANEYHAVQAIEALEAGKSVMIEKPMALTHKDADDIEAARVKSGKVAFVGYMRRYATAFLRVKELIKEAKEINYVRVRDIIGMNSFFVEQSGVFTIPITDIPKSAMDDKAVKAKDIFGRAIGEEKAKDPKEVMFWNLLGGLASHDLSAMRELIGMPEKVLSVSRKAGPGGVFVTVHFQFQGFSAYYEMIIDHVKKFDAHIEVITEDKHIKVTYDTPYIKGLPITATVLKTSPEGDFVEENIRPTYKDAYTLEYEELYEVIVNGKEVKTSPLDAKKDLDIFTMIANACDGPW